MIIGIKYGYMHVGFTYPSIMEAFKQHCIELIGDKKQNYKTFIKFLWGIKVQDFDALYKEIESMEGLLKREINMPLSKKSLRFLDDDEKEDYINSKGIQDFFISSSELSDTFFLNIFLNEIERVKEDGEENISINSMAMRPDMVDEYGWNYPTKIPKEVKDW